MKKPANFGAIIRREHLETRLAVLKECYELSQDAPEVAARIGAVMERVRQQMRAGPSMGVWYRWR